MKYTFRDGSTLPPRRYLRVTWEIDALDARATLSIHRQDEEAVNIFLSEPSVEGPDVPQPSLRLYRVKDKAATLIEFPTVGFRVPAGVGGGGGKGQGQRGVKLPIGQPVQAELRLGKKTVTSPVLEP
jgi:hypothetical protein